MLNKSNTRNAIVASLHFSPVFASHALAYAKLLAESGFAVTFLLDPRYAGFADFEAVGPVVAAGELRKWLKSNLVEMAIFANCAVGNRLAAKAVRTSGAQVWYVFHEPDPIRNRLGESWKDIFKLIIAKFASIAMLRAATGVLVPSDRARSLYMRYFKRYNRNVHTLHLLFDDGFGPDQTVYDYSRRKYFSLLGGATKAHNIDAFVEFAKYAVRSECGFAISIATRSDLSQVLSCDREFADYVKEGKILLQHGRVLSGAEMDAKFLDSFCVWNLYKYSTQSGVLPRAFMTGTAVIAARMGSFEEFVKPGVNGEFVESAADFDAIIQAAKKIRQNIPAYVQGCRASFFGTFHYRAGRKALAAILAPQATANQVGSENLPQPRGAGAD